MFIKKLLGKLIKGRYLDLSNLNMFRLFSIALRFTIAFLRSILFIRRFGFVMGDVEVRSSQLLKVKSTFILEKGVLLDCYGEYGISLGCNFKLGRNSIISVPGSILSKGSGVCIGDNVGIGDFSYIGGEGFVRIGSNTISGQYLSIHPENHTYIQSGLFRDSPTCSKGITIGNNIWIGSKVTILDGTVIEDNCIIAAGSVVTGHFPKNSLIAGVPAKVKKSLCN